MYVSNNEDELLFFKLICNLVKFVPQPFGNSWPSSAESISRGFTLFDIDPKRRKRRSPRCPSGLMPAVDILVYETEITKFTKIAIIY